MDDLILRGEHNNGASEAANCDEVPDAAEVARDAAARRNLILRTGRQMARQLDECVSNGASEAANRGEVPDAAEEACDAAVRPRRNFIPFRQGAAARQLDEWASRQRQEDWPPPFDKRRRLNPVHDKLWIPHVESSLAAPSSSPSSLSNAAPSSSSKAAPRSPSTAAPNSSSKAAPFDNNHDSSDDSSVEEFN